MSACPYTNSPEWKSLTSEVGELEAYAIFIDNNYAMPEKADYKKPTEEKFWPYVSSEKEARDLKVVTKIRKEMLDSLATKIKIFDKYNLDEGQKKYVDNLKNILKELTGQEVKLGMLNFVNHAEKAMTSLIERMNKEEKTLQDLKNIYEFASTYEILKELKPISHFKEIMKKNHDFEENNPEATELEKQFAKLPDKIANVLSDFGTLKNQYIYESREILAGELAAQSTFMRSRERLNLSKKFDEDNKAAKKSLSKTEYAEKKDAFIEEGLENKKVRLLQKERRRIANLLERSPIDISEATKMLSDPRNILKLPMVQITVKMLDDSDFKTQTEFIDSRSKFMKVFNKLTNGKTKTLTPTEQKKLYEGVIEKIDGKETQYYVREAYSTYYDLERQMWKEYNAAINGLDQNNKFVMTTNAFSQIVPVRDANGKPTYTAEWANAIKILKDFANEHFEPYKYNPERKGFNYDKLKSHHKNPQWKDLQSPSNASKKEMYDLLVEFNKESDSMVKGNEKLGYRLPGERKGLGERLTDNKLKDAAKQSITESFKIKEDDYGYGDVDVDDNGKIEILTDQKGAPLKKIAMPYRARVPISEQSYDLAGMALTNRYHSLNMKNKSDILVDLEVLSDLMDSRKVIKKKGDRTYVRKAKDILGISTEELQDIEIDSDGKLSHGTQLFKEILETRLYGVSKIASSVLGVDSHKLTDKLIGFSGFNNLVANAAAGTSNVITGKIMNFFMAIAGEHFKGKHLRASEVDYWGNMAGFVSDIGRYEPQNKLNLLSEKFINTSMDVSFLSNKLSKDNKFKRLFSGESLGFINNVAEHYIQITLMGAVLRNIKLKNKNGSYIDKEGNVVSRKDAISLHEAYEKKDGKLFLDSKYVIEKGLTDADVSRKVKDVIADTAGMYDKINKAMVERRWWGRLGSFLRNWMDRLINAHWRGVGQMKKSIDDREDYELQYSEFSQEFKEGNFVTALRFLIQIKKTLKEHKTKVLSKNWEKLYDFEKANIRKTTAELLTAITALIAGGFLAGLADAEDDEDKKQNLYFLAYLMRRQWGELSFYHIGALTEGTRVLRTPSATVTTVETLQKTFNQFLEDALNGFEMETYQSGRRKGKTKLFHLMRRLFDPVYKNISDRDYKQMYNYLKNPPN